MWTKRLTACPRAPHAFTVIELVVVILVLAALTAVTLPQLTRGSGPAPDAPLRDMLRYVRAQIGAYRSQHGLLAPGRPPGDLDRKPDAETFVAQMTQYSDVRGGTHHSRVGPYVLGPYLPEMPANPFNGRNGILIVSGGAFPAPDTSQPYGWMYSPDTQQLVANVEGSDSEGVAYASY